MPRLVCCALFLACSIGCSGDPTPTSTENPLNSSPSLAEQDAQVHTTVVLTQEVDYSLNGTIDETARVTTSYDQRGNALIVDLETNRAGSVRRRVTTSSYNKWGNVLEQVIELDPGDGRYWFTTVETDKWGHPSRQLGQQPDYNNDGEPETFRTRSYPSYDNQGRPLQEVVENDHDGDGALETRTTQTMSYDQHSSVVQLTSDSDVLMDGSSEYGFRTVSTYNGYGEVVHQISEFYDFEEGTWGSTTTTTAFDGRGNPITRVTEDDYAPFDGIVGSRYVLTASFDERHRPVTEVSDLDLGADGTVERRVTRTYEYFGALAPPSASRIGEISSRGHWRNGLGSGVDDAGPTEIGIMKPSR